MNIHTQKRYHFTTFAPNFKPPKIRNTKKHQKVSAFDRTNTFDPASQRKTDGIFVKICQLFQENALLPLAFLAKIAHTIGVCLWGTVKSESRSSCGHLRFRICRRLRSAERLGSPTVRQTHFEKHDQSEDVMNKILGLLSTGFLTLTLFLGFALTVPSVSMAADGDPTAAASEDGAKKTVKKTVKKKKKTAQTKEAEEDADEEKTASGTKSPFSSNKVLFAKISFGVPSHTSCPLRSTRIRSAYSATSSIQWDTRRIAIFLSS